MQKYIIESFDSVAPKLKKLLDTNPNRSITYLFKSLRNDSRVDLLGDYLILSNILETGHFRIPQYRWSRTQILRAVRLSGFYKDIPRKRAYIPEEWSKYVKG